MSAVGDSNLTGASAPVSGKPPLPLPRRLLRMRSDAALAERFAAGDEAAFDVIYERHRPAVLAVCMGVLGAAHDAEDATQETFSSLSVALRSHPPKELRPWLTRVARNASIDTTRRRRHRLLTIDGEVPDVPARQHTGAAELNSVLDGIRELPEGQRTALLMRELGGHSYAEIASFLEVDEDAVRGLIARARVGLRAYREAAEFPCAAARAAIETEPDGRRYDRTVRRHLRGCDMCRSYRAALRGDAKALRAVFPWQAGGFAGGGFAAGGAVTAAKSAIMGVGLAQVAATCAASVCAVGAVGGVVLLDPAHRLLTPVKLTAKPSGHHHVTRAAHSTQPKAPVVHTASAPAMPAVSKPSAPAPAEGVRNHDSSRRLVGLTHSPQATANDRRHGWNWIAGPQGSGQGQGDGTVKQTGGPGGGQGFRSGGSQVGGDSQQGGGKSSPPGTQAGWSHDPRGSANHGWQGSGGWSSGNGAGDWSSGHGAPTWNSSQQHHRSSTSMRVAIGRFGHGRRSHQGLDR